MTLVEGVGDEVVQFVAVLLVLIVAALAWWSTNARPDRYRTVLVMRSRTTRPVTVSIRRVISSNTSNNVTTTTSLAEPATTTSAGVNTLEAIEMDSIVDADLAMISNHRLHFYRRVETSRNNLGASDSTEESESPDDTEPASNDQMREMDSIVSAMEADADPFTRDGETTSSSNITSKAEIDQEDQKATKTSSDLKSQDNVDSQDNAEDTSEATQLSDDRKILIKLKYLNDTFKEVEGSLDELLKDFKWRHFCPELSSERRVRLIFRGRVLDDAATLAACGLHHRAVVHCLVHPKRSTAQRVIQEESMNGPEVIAEGMNPQERTWDLENILMTLVSVALTVVWFFRCEYSNMFTASASLALFGLTVFYSVAIFGLYLSDTFHFDRRPPQPVPNN